MANRTANVQPFLSPELRVVEASAGSGKTYALAKRYVQLILGSDGRAEQLPIRNILALTFTNKAAFEMKARILKFLKKIALKKLSAEQRTDILRPLGLDSDEASNRAYAVMEGIIRHYNFFQVQTIDKFINALLSGCAFKIGLTANFKIRTDAEEYLQYSLDELIDQAGRNKAVLKAFEQFVHHYLYLENRTGWFPKDDMLAIMTMLFEQANAYGVDFLEGPFTPEDVLKSKRLILAEMKALHRVLPEGTHAGFARSLDDFLQAHDKAFDIDDVSEYFTREDVPVKKGSKVSASAEKSWKKIRSHLKQLCTQEAYSLFNPYVQVFAQAMQGFFDLAAKDDCLFLNELNKKAGLLFDKEHVTVEELYYRLAARFRHYLIDEFQDTSRLQWHNLEKMVEEGLSQGGTLFYVGDRKQAIYGFRGGDAGLFDDVKKTFKNFNVRTEWLTNNWRSQKAIVEFNNAVFSVDNLERFVREKEAQEVEAKKKTAVLFTEEDMAVLKNIFAGAQQTCRPENKDGYVRMECVDEDKKEDRDAVIRAKLIGLIRELKERFAYRDVAVLTRGNQEVKEVTQWLLEEGLPAESERTSDITENGLVRELVAFLQFLNSPVDNIAFSTFILGDIFAKATGSSREEMHRFIFGLRQRLSAEQDLYIYTEFRERYPKIWDIFIHEFFSNAGLYPLYELLITIYGRYNVLAFFREDQGFLMHFLELVKKAEEEHTDIQSFLEYYEHLEGEDLYVHITDSDAVRIMTVHKAKGLEFPVVILPFLGVDIQIGAKSGEYQPSYVARPQAQGMQLLRLKTKYLKFSPELEELYAQEYKKALVDELNTVYVALTRAKYELYWFIPKKVGNSRNSARFMIPEDLYQCGGPKKYPAEHTDDKIIVSIPPAEYPDWIDYLKDEFYDVSELKHRQQRLRGEMMHFALERIGNLSAVDREQAIREAFEAAEAQFAGAPDWPECQRRLKQILAHKELQPFFACAGAEVLTEKEIVTAAGHTKRCDRLIIRSDEVWIVDFKSARDSAGRDREQILEYKAILKDIYVDRTIKGFLIYLDEMKAEEA